MKFVTLFPEGENVHLIKSCGMVPYNMIKMGYDSTFVSYNNDEYHYIEKDVKGLKMKFLKKIVNNKLLDSLFFLSKNSKKIDVLHMYHLSKRTLLCAMLYKKINKNGVVYLKLDNTDKNYFGEKYDGNLILKLKFFLMKFYDIISTESVDCQQYINSNFPLNLEYIPNGFYEPLEKIKINNKENIILTVSRIGTFQKNNELMLDAFSKIYQDIPTWKLKLVGPIDNQFNEKINSVFEKNPGIKNQIEFVGEVKDRSKLNRFYNEAKIFTLSSRYEGFPTVYLEALKSGCYLVSTNFNVAKEITKNGEYGFVVENENEYAQALIDTCNNINFNDQLQQSIQEYAVQEYYWPSTAEKLDYLIKKALESKVRK